MACYMVNFTQFSTFTCFTVILLQIFRLISILSSRKADQAVSKEFLKLEFPTVHHNHTKLSLLEPTQN